MKTIFLNQNRHRILSGHPWVFQSEVLRLEGDPIDGETVEIKTARGQFLGCGIYNSKSQIVVRRYSRERRPLDRAFLSETIDAALAFRKKLHGSKPPGAERLVWSESDGLPGLIVDRYHKTLVVQTLTLAMGRLEETIADILVEKTGIPTVIARNDALSRKLEGLPLEKKILRGAYEAPTLVELAGIRWELDLLSGQKTGFYLDQVQNYGAIAAYAQGRRVLDCFTNQGGFALSALKAGAVSAVGIDQSAEALARAQAAASRNGLSAEQASWKEGNVFDLLRAWERERKQFDLVVLDPPSFTKTKAQRESALRGYHELHVRGLHLLAPGGLLATFCCSHHVGEEEWRLLLEEAASDTGSTLRLRRRLTQTSDHPIVVGIPETEYLRGYLLEKIG